MNRIKYFKSIGRANYIVQSNYPDAGDKMLSAWANQFKTTGHE